MYAHKVIVRHVLIIALHACTLVICISCNVTAVGIYNSKYNSFHGTPVSITNYLFGAFPGVERDYNQIQPAESLQRKGVGHIPSSYSTFPPATLQNKNPVIPQLQSYSQPTGILLSEARDKEKQWLKEVAENLDKIQYSVDDCLSWQLFMLICNLLSAKESKYCFNAALP